MVYKIVAITDDGNVKLKKYEDDGSLESKVLVSKFEIFTKRYKRSKNARVLADWPKLDIRNDRNFATDAKRSLIEAVVHDFYLNTEHPKLVIQEKPKVAVFVGDAMKKGAMKIPIVGAVEIVDVKDERLSRAVQIKCADLKDRVAILKPHGKTPYGRIGHASADGSANVSIDYKMIEVSLDKKKCKIGIPYVTNISPLKSGDEICFEAGASSAKPKVAGIRRTVDLFSSPKKKAKANS